ncbi:hypothetical protein Areg01_21420 [Actinoplanes regularis]|nr:hypothetical protein Areg01_21420 [Actinoplanes regularis]
MEVDYPPGDIGRRVANGVRFRRVPATQDRHLAGFPQHVIDQYVPRVKIAQRLRYGVHPVPIEDDALPLFTH